MRWVGGHISKALREGLQNHLHCPKTRGHSGPCIRLGCQQVLAEEAVLCNASLLLLVVNEGATLTPQGPVLSALFPQNIHHGLEGEPAQMEH